MRPKFALMTLAASLHQIPVRYSHMRIASELLPTDTPSADLPPTHLLAYIRRFNPFTMDSVTVLGECGYKVTLPLTHTEWENEPTLCVQTLTKTCAALKDFAVEIAAPPIPNRLSYRDEIPTPGNLLLTDGRYMFCFLCAGAATKALKLMRKPRDAVEVLVIGGARALTQCLLENIYPYVHFISLLHRDEREAAYFEARAESLLADSGLYIPVNVKNTYLPENADIIINLDANGACFERYYKRNAIYFELSGDARRCAALAVKRPDMLCVDGLRVGCQLAPTRPGEILNLPVFEMIVFTKCPDFREVLRGKCDGHLIQSVRRAIQSLNAHITAFCRQGQPLDTAALTRLHLNAVSL